MKKTKKIIELSTGEKREYHLSDALEKRWLDSFDDLVLTVGNPKFGESFSASLPDDNYSSDDDVVSGDSND